MRQMKTNQMCSFCAGDPKAALIISFEKLCMSPSRKFNQSEIITSCFFISLLHRFTSFVLLHAVVQQPQRLRDVICKCGPLYC